MDEKTAIESTSITALASAVKWLEDEQHRLKAQALRLQQQLEQVYTATVTLGDKLTAVDGSISSVILQTSRMGRVEEEVRQAAELLSRLRDIQSADAARISDLDRTRQAEAERERHERQELQHKISDLERNSESVYKRVEAMDEVHRRQQEGVLQVFQRLERLDKGLETVQASISIETERSRRLEQTMADLGREVEATRKQGEFNASRLQLLADQLKRVEEAGSAVMAEEGMRRELGERVDAQKFHLQRLERQIAERLQELEDFREKQETHTRLLTQLDLRINAGAEGLDELREHLLEQQQHMDEQVSAWFQLEEQQKRRQLNELEQQLRDLRQRPSRLRETQR